MNPIIPPGTPEYNASTPKLTTSQGSQNFPLPHAPEGPETAEGNRPYKKRNVQEIKSDDLDSDIISNPTPHSGHQRRRVTVNPNSISSHLNELSKKVGRNPDSAAQFVKEYVENTVALPTTKGNKATVIRELFRAIDEGILGDHKETVHAILSEYAYPTAERKADLDKIHALAQQKFPDNEVIKEKFISLMEELFCERHGVVPQWLEVKRAHPKTNVTMARQNAFSSLHSRVKSANIQQTESSAPSSTLGGHPAGLFRSSTVSPKEYLKDPDFQKICELKLPGIGLQKGGISAITDIMADGMLVATWHGKISPVLPGAPLDTCATLHGPLFAILDNSSIEYSRPPGQVSEFPEDCILCYLVPTAADKEKITEALAFGKEYGIISPEEVQRLQAKVKTFQEFSRENS